MPVMEKDAEGSYALASDSRTEAPPEQEDGEYPDFLLPQVSAELNSTAIGMGREFINLHEVHHGQPFGHLIPINGGRIGEPQEGIGLATANVLGLTLSCLALLGPNARNFQNKR